MKKNKFTKGSKIRNINALMIRIGKGQWTYFNHKPQHPGVIQSMTLRTLINAINNGILYTAKENK